MAARQGRRLAGVDILRGVAVLAVFVYHGFLEADLQASRWLAEVYSGPFSFFFPHHLGTFGVQLFFVVSGFCIHESMQAWVRANPGATATEQWRGYARRRLLRIYPLYAVTLLAVFLALHAAPFTPGGAADLLVHAALLQTLVPDHVNKINPSLWSLAVEAHLYALYPLLWTSLHRLQAAPRRQAALLLGVALGCLAWAVVVPQLTANWTLLHLPWRWGFEWVLGVAVAELSARGIRAGGALTAACGVALVLALAPSRSPAHYAALPPIFFALLVSWASALREPRRSAAGALGALGRISYAFYLIHQPLLSVLGPGVPALVVSVLAARGLETAARRILRAADGPRAGKAPA